MDGKGDDEDDGSYDEAPSPETPSNKYTYSNQVSKNFDILISKKNSILKIILKLINFI